MHRVLYASLAGYIEISISKHGSFTSKVVFNFQLVASAMNRDIPNHSKDNMGYHLI